MSNLLSNSFMGSENIIVKRHKKISLFLICLLLGLGVEIDKDISYTISGNNIDGYIITEWR